MKESKESKESESKESMRIGNENRGQVTENRDQVTCLIILLNLFLFYR